MAKSSQPPGKDKPGDGNVYDLFTGRPTQPGDDRLIRLAPELDGLEMLYSNRLNPNKLFAMKILCWGLRANGEVVGLIPWMDDMIACTDIDDPLEGKFQGYFDPGIDDIFHEAPLHKVVELESAAEYYEVDSDNPYDIVQEIPDTLGTHAVFNGPSNNHLYLTPVVSWQLHNDGTLHGMVVNEKLCTDTPVLPGDACLYCAASKENFRYYFQHHIANKIKAKDPEALAAIAMLAEREHKPEDRKHHRTADVIRVDRNQNKPE